MTTTTTPTQKQDNSLAIISMVLGIVSLTGPGLLLGIPAIITGAMALRRQSENRGMSMTGLITGIVSTVFSVLFIGFMIFMFILGALSEDDGSTYRDPGDAPASSRYENLHT